MTLQTITRKGKQFVLVPLEEFERWHAEGIMSPPMDELDGSSNAIDFARSVIARRLVSERHAAKLSQQQLASLSGVRQETISRIESGKQTATVRIIDKLDKIFHSRRTSSRRKAG